VLWQKERRTVVVSVVLSGVNPKFISFCAETAHATASAISQRQRLHIYRGREAARRLVDRLDRGSARCERAGTNETELLKSLREALVEALEFNREEARRAAEGEYIEEPVMV